MQLQLLDLMLRKGKRDRAAGRATRTDLIGLMARVLAVVFQEREERVDDRGFVQPQIKPEHLARKAAVYLRQSSEKQVRQNQESQQLQYVVAERVPALGGKQVEIIKSDLGSSASIASAQREGFEPFLSSVALGEVGIVGSREVSRLSRTDKDWRRLREVCQIFGTLNCRRAAGLRFESSRRPIGAGHERNTQRSRTEGHSPTNAGGPRSPRRAAASCSKDSRSAMP